MTNRITTYEELVLEQHRLKVLLHGQKEIIRQDINEIKEELVPVKSAIKFIGKITSQDSGNPLINGAVNTVIDMVVRKGLLAKAGWFAKLIVPFFVKNYSSHLIDEKKDNIIRQVFSWFSKKNKNGKGHYKDGEVFAVDEEEEEED